MGVLLFNRSVTVDVDAMRITALRMAFKIEKDATSKTPNKCDLQIWNLSDFSRSKIQTSGAHVVVTAGYDGQVEKLFDGQVTTINHTKQGPDWVTRLTSGDGVFATRGARVNENFAPGTQLVDAFKTIAEKTGLALGNVVEEIKKGNVRNALTQWTKGAVVSGVAIDEVHKLAATMGYEVTVQDGALQIAERGSTVGNEIVRLAEDTGLIGSPEMGEKDQTDILKARHITKARSLIQQRLMPGRSVLLNSARINGLFRIEKVTFVGDTHDTPWYADLEMTAQA
jgi:hypothetical protein